MYYAKDFNLPVKDGFHACTTTNKSFLLFARLLKAKGVKNYDFLLKLIDPSLEAIDPWVLDISGAKNPTIEYRRKVISECLKNPWYFLREVVRIKPISSKELQSYEANPGNIAQVFCFFNNLSSLLNGCRQISHKSSNLGILMLYQLIFGNTTIDNPTLYTAGSSLYNTIYDIMVRPDSKIQLPNYIWSFPDELTGDDVDENNKYVIMGFNQVDFGYNCTHTPTGNCICVRTKKNLQGDNSYTQVFGDDINRIDFGVDDSLQSMLQKSLCTLAAFGNYNSESLGNIPITAWTDAIYDYSQEQLQQFNENNRTIIMIRTTYQDMGYPEKYLEHFIRGWVSINDIHIDCNVAKELTLNEMPFQSTSSNLKEELVIQVVHCVVGHYLKGTQIYIIDDDKSCDVSEDYRSMIKNIKLTVSPSYDEMGKYTVYTHLDVAEPLDDINIIGQYAASPMRLYWRNYSEMVDEFGRCYEIMDHKDFGGIFKE